MELPFTLASSQVTATVRVSSISSVAELPFPETGYTGLEQSLYIQHQHSDTVSTPPLGQCERLLAAVHTQQQMILTGHL